MQVTCFDTRAPGIASAKRRICLLDVAFDVDGRRQDVTTLNVFL